MESISYKTLVGFKGWLFVIWPNLILLGGHLINIFGVRGFDKEVFFYLLVIQGVVNLFLYFTYFRGGTTVYSINETGILYPSKFKSDVLVPWANVIAASSIRIAFSSSRSNKDRTHKIEIEVQKDGDPVLPPLRGKLTDNGNVFTLAFVPMARFGDYTNLINDINRFKRKYGPRDQVIYASKQD